MSDFKPTAMGKSKKRSTGPLTEKERRRERKKIEKQIAQGKKKIKLANGTVLDGQRLKAQRTAGYEMRAYYERWQRYLAAALVAAIVARVFTAWAIPAGFRVLVFLLCVPIFFIFRLLLNALLPQSVDNNSGRVVRQSGGSYYNTLFSFALAIEFTKFFQYVILVIGGDGSDGTTNTDVDDTLANAENLGEDEVPDPDWQPPKVTPQVGCISCC